MYLLRSSCLITVALSQRLSGSLKERAVPLGVRYAKRYV